MIENSMCYDITTDKFDKEYDIFSNSTSNLIRKEQYKSLMKVGNVNIYNTKHFNWFQKVMWKIFLGIKIQDIKGSGK